MKFLVACHLANMMNRSLVMPALIDFRVPLCGLFDVGALVPFYTLTSRASPKIPRTFY